MNPSNKTSKKQLRLPPRVDFRTWKDQFDRTLRPSSPEGKAFKCWMAQKVDYYSFLGVTERAERDSLVQEIFEMTCPPMASDAEAKKHRAAVTKVKELLPMLNSTIGSLKACGPQVAPKDGSAPPTLSDLSLHLEESAFKINIALLYLDWPYMRSADVLSYCWPFISSLVSSGITEPDAVCLAEVAMKAHGFTQDEIEVLSKKSQRAGTIRKRREKGINNFFDTGESAMQRIRQHKDLPEINLAKYRKKNE